jgi:aspartate aminotransferase-like enzyme
MVYALREALRLVAEEGLEKRYDRHLLHFRAVLAGLEALELDLFAHPSHRLPTVLAVQVPDGVNDARVRAGLLNEYGIEIAGGLGEYAGKMWRIGIMGYSASQVNVLMLLTGLEALLAREGNRSGVGDAVNAANAVYTAATANAAGKPRG